MIVPCPPSSIFTTAMIHPRFLSHVPSTSSHSCADMASCSFGPNVRGRMTMVRSISLTNHMI